MTLPESIGWLGNACFFARVVVQLYAVERRGTSDAPVGFWILSLAGSVFLAYYAVERQTPVLLIGFVTNGLIYGRNLVLMRGTSARPQPATVAMCAFVALLALVGAGVLAGRASPANVGLWVVCGTLGQAVWSSRFVVQWWHSERARTSHFPAAFWWVGLCGNGLLLAYAIHLGDAVFVTGLLPVPLVHARNLWRLYRKPPRGSESDGPARAPCAPLHPDPLVRERVSAPLRPPLEASRSFDRIRSSLSP